MRRCRIKISLDLLAAFVFSGSAVVIAAAESKDGCAELTVDGPIVPDVELAAGEQPPLRTCIVHEERSETETGPLLRRTVEFR